MLIKKRREGKTEGAKLRANIWAKAVILAWLCWND
jgi:hypothetical protein